MGSTLKYTEEIDSVYISGDIDFIIGTVYSEYSEDIIEALGYIPYRLEDSVAGFAFKVGDDEPVFFEIAVYYSGFREATLDGVRKIDINDFLDHVKHNTWLKYGI